MWDYFALFGRTQREKARGLAPGVPDDRDTPAGTDIRFAWCDVCHQDRQARFTDEGFAIPGPPDPGSCSPAIPFVASCPNCDRDVCSECAKGPDAPVPEGTSAGAEPAGSHATAPRPADAPLCPDCRSRLESKTCADERRYNDGLPTIKNQALPSEQRRVVARRLLRICQEEAPLFGPRICEKAGPSGFDEIRKWLMHNANS